MKPNDNCPYCGAIGIFLTGYPTPDGRGLLKERSCGSTIDTLYPEYNKRSSRCQDREALQKAQAEVKELKENAERIGANRYQQLCDAETENTKLRKLLDKALSLVGCVYGPEEMEIHHHIETAYKELKK